EFFSMCCDQRGVANHNSRWASGSEEIKMQSFTCLDTSLPQSRSKCLSMGGKAMDADDREIGRILSRREALALLGAGAAMVIGCSRQGGLSASTSTFSQAETPCLVRPKQTEGPYFSDGQVERSDIRTDPSTGVARPGVPLQLAFHVTRPRNGECLPLEGMRIDIWHCDALGRYSDFRREGTAGEQFLRGYQVTGRDGRVQFITIYPGWYEGRTVHIHFKIRTDPVLSRTYDFTSQLYFNY